MRTIKVTGIGRVKLRPDTTRLTLTLSGTAPAYDAALSASAGGTGALSAALEPVGFVREDLKTQTFSITAEYESYEEDGGWKQRFAGYRYLHVLGLDFPADNDRLGRILAALADCPVDAELRISYTVKDPDAARKELLDRAVADAGDRAYVLAEAAGVALRAIQSIDCSAGERSFEVCTMDALAKPMAAKARFDMDIRPEDIDAAQAVTVVWEIE